MTHRQIAAQIIMEALLQRKQELQEAIAGDIPICDQTLRTSGKEKVVEFYDKLTKKFIERMDKTVNKNKE